MQAGDREFLGHLARQHDDRDIGVEFTRHAQRRQRIESRQVVVCHDHVEASGGERGAQAGFVLDALGVQRAQRGALAQQQRQHQVVVEVGVLDDQKADRGGVFGGHGRILADRRRQVGRPRAARAGLTPFEPAYRPLGKQVACPESATGRHWAPPQSRRQ